MGRSRNLRGNFFFLFLLRDGDQIEYPSVNTIRRLRKKSPFFLLLFHTKTFSINSVGI